MLKIARPLRLSALSLALLAASPLIGANTSLAATAADTTQRTTQDGDNLWNMSMQVGRDQAKPVQQWMVAVLRRNPDAFVLGNIHRLRSGVGLVLPSEADVQAENVAEATALIIRHQQAVQSNTPMPVLIAPLAAPGLATAPAPIASAASSPAVTPPTATPATGSASEAVAIAVPGAAATDAAVGTPAQALPGPPWRRWLPHAVAASLLLMVGALIWRVRRSGASEFPQAVSTLFQDTLQLLQGKPRLPAISTAAADMARSVEKLDASARLVRFESEAESGVTQTRSATAGEVAIKLELARALIEVGRKDAARLTLRSVLREGTAAQQEQARQQLLAIDAV